MFAILYLLIAFGIVVGLEQAGLLAATFHTTSQTLVGTAATVVFVWAIGLLQIRLVYRAALRERWRIASLLIVGYAILQLGAFALILLGFHWGGWLASIEVARGWSLLDIPLLRDLLLLAPALTLAAVAIAARYHLDEALRPRVWTRRSHFAFNFRWVIVPLPVVLLVRLLTQGIDWLVYEAPLGLARVDMALPALTFLLQFLPILITLLFLPWLLRLVLPTSPIRSSWLRARLRALDERVGVRVREVRVWHLGRARIPNAMVTGLTPGSRHIFLSDAMLDSFTLDELEGVYCHELGHARHRHLLLYLAVIIGLLVFTYAVVEPGLLILGQAAGLTTAGIQAVQLSVASVLILGVLMTMLTRVSRLNERQADLTGCVYARNPLGIVFALEKINRLMGGQLRNRPSPTHGSIARRVEFVLAVLRDPTVGRKFLHVARRAHLALWMVAALCVATYVFPLVDQVRHAPTMARILDVLAVRGGDEVEPRPSLATLAPMRREMDRMAAELPNDPRVRYFQAVVADFQARAADETNMRARFAREALEAYDQALANAPFGFPANIRFDALRRVERLREGLLGEPIHVPSPAVARQ